jgi:hypothetical protein
MNIQNFRTKLSSDNNRVFATLRKLTAMDSKQLAAFQAESSNQGVTGEWAIWSGN